MNDKEKQFLKWCESMPKDYMKFLWRLWMVNYAMDDFITGKEDSFGVSMVGLKEPKPFRSKAPKISNEDIMKAALKLNMSVEDFDKVMKKKLN